MPHPTCRVVLSSMALHRFFHVLDDVRGHVQFAEHTHQLGDIMGFVVLTVILRERLANSSTLQCGAQEQMAHAGTCLLQWQLAMRNVHDELR